MTDRRARLADVVRREALLRGHFKLSSGGTSDVYLDCRRATLHPEGSWLTASLLLDWLDAEGIGVDCVGGPSLGADPIVGAMVALSHDRDRPLPGFLVRKEAKEHGTAQLLEGQHRPGWRALVVEDTTTTGRSLLQAVQAAEEGGLHVVATACLVDRGEKTAAMLQGYRFHAIFKFDEVLKGG